MDFKISFNPPSIIRSRSAPQYFNDYRFIGSGHVVVGDSRITVVGKCELWPLPLVKTEEKSFQIADIQDLQIESNCVWLEVASSGQRRYGLFVWFETPQAADDFLGLVGVPGTNARSGNILRMLGKALKRLQEHPWAPVTYALVILSFSLFTIAISKGAGWNSLGSEVQIGLGSNYAPFTTAGDWWRLFTAALVHFSPIHLLVNMWLLIAIGPILERTFGSFKLAVIAAACACAGNIASVWWNPTINTGGMSSIIFGGFGAILATSTASGNQGAKILLRPFRMPLVYVCACLIGLAAIGNQIDNPAHIAAFLTGIAIGPQAVPFELVSARSSARKYGWLVWAVLSIALIVTAFAALQNSQSRLRGAGLYWHVVHRMGRNEDEVNARWRSIVDQARSGATNDLHVADHLESKVLPFWVETSTELSAISLGENSALESDLQDLLSVASQREDALRLCISGLRTHNSNTVAECNHRMELIDEIIAARATRTAAHR